MQKYRPNHIPKSTRIFNLVWCCFLLGVALYGWSSGSLYFPGRASSNGVTFVGLPLLFFIIALVIASANAVLTIIDHYDQRDNEFAYKKLSKALNVLCIIAILGAFGYQFVLNQKPAVILSDGS
ncbi:hypothetical protein [Alteromonas ponticola]|uniref:Uncharacterized protein n=1 Tax=Alteromonas ponticola TaxID=2720613 RepID=A0ABX1QWS5_9ALTE|nr:hypothetical protein [Alteromonas ponticola]NMH58698.1 hypothetical protein [Alteromonas ponticola]